MALPLSSAYAPHLPHFPSFLHHSKFFIFFLVCVCVCPTFFCLGIVIRFKFHSAVCAPHFLSTFCLLWSAIFVRYWTTLLCLIWFLSFIHFASCLSLLHSSFFGSLIGFLSCFSNCRPILSSLLYSRFNHRRFLTRQTCLFF